MQFTFPSRLLYILVTFLQSFSANGAAQHACYDDTGNLAIVDPLAGTPDRVGIEPWFSESAAANQRLPTVIGKVHGN